MNSWLHSNTKDFGNQWTRCETKTIWNNCGIPDRPHGRNGEAYGSGVLERKKVFITGHTGFKGAWLCLWLYTLGAKPVGYALHPPTNPSLFGLGNLQDIVPTIYADVRDGGRLRQALADADADIVIHMAAQPLVRESYQDPVYTYQTNIMGTVHLLEAVRHLNTKGPTRTKSIINVTTDKCYDNREWIWGYRENDPLTPTPAAKHVPSLSRQLTAIPIFIRLNTISIKSVLQRRGQATLSEG
ncbi:GDP-mannose 4,6-dehydratase [Paenibacillus larvae]|nr:GDP-mannose 4,6-dehydratase [Paenibacillus larvae]MDT2239698.1 GDP-mannose 4,6-dehydratase [Paenibacillus larvae]MDT2286325.1 GDP-mannose 4,6-dehydratase [Paenibacillus larvae]